MFAGALRVLPILIVAALLMACGGGANPDQSATPPVTADATIDGGVTQEPSPTETAEETPTPEATETSAATTEPDGEGDQVSVFDLEVGMCINLPSDPEPSPRATAGETAGPALYASVIEVPCAEPHQYEVIALVVFDADEDEEYPGDEEVDRFVDGECEDAFEGYVGIDYTESLYYLHTLPPSESTWEADDDREAACLLYEPTEEDYNVPREWTGSARDSEE